MDLKETRRIRGMTQEKLAWEAGLASNTVKKMEQGKIAHPAFETVYAICRVLDVEPGQVDEFARLMGQRGATA